jgi:hypothetical protein
MTDHNTLEPWQWGLILTLSAFVLYAITDVAARLLAARKNRTGPPPYNWHLDDGLLDAWARDAEGEVLTVGHLIQWRMK